MTAPLSLPIHVLQGQIRVSGDPDAVFTSILGSCVSACMWDPARRVGGLNHFLLPGADPQSNNNLRYGQPNVEALLSALGAHGARRSTLQAWLFGGGNVLEGQTGIGQANAAWALSYLRAEGIALRGHDLGGTRGRRVIFHPFYGTPQVTLLPRSASPCPAASLAPNP